VVGAEEERGRQAQVEGSGRPLVDHQLDCRRLLDGEVRGPGTFEDAVDVARGASEQVGDSRPVADQAARLREFPLV